MQLSEMDEKLINVLRKDGRANYTALAKKYNTSSATISRRVASLIRNEVIKITVVPNPSKLLGFSAVAYLGLQAELKKIDRISDELSSFPEVYTVMTLMSSFSMLAIVVLPNFELLYKFITNKIAPIDGMIKVETLIRAELVKRTYLAFNLEETLNQLEIDNGI
jgi:Lrp/AsnC family transcriptional regulator for asnA, asnC and gidA